MSALTALFLILTMFRLALAFEDRELISYLGNTVIVTNGESVINYEQKQWVSTRVIDRKIGDPNSCDCCAAFSRPAWIHIDLGEPHPFIRIEIIGRNDKYSSQSSNVNISVDDGFSSTSTIYKIHDLNGTFTVNKSESLPFVKSINVSSVASDQYNTILTICEVRVFQKVVNITSQSSVYQTCYSQNALNNLNFTESGENDGLICKACSVTNGEVNKDPWWELDLGRASLLREIYILGRTDTTTELSSQSKNLVVYISNTTLKSSQHSTGAIYHCTDTSCGLVFPKPRIARYINVHHSLQYPVLTLCRVRVYAGECSGRYGDNCTYECSNNCLNFETCNNLNGECPSGCIDGYDYDIDKTCATPCSSRYGHNCTSICSTNCFSNSTCNFLNGECSNGCAPGYDYKVDRTCKTTCVRRYGLNCTSECKHCRNNATCSNLNGTCPDGCVAGYDYGTDKTCTTPCSGYFGEMCSSQCHCNNTAYVCDPFNGTCATGCLQGWSGSNCSVDLNIIRSGKYNVSVSQSSNYSNCTAERAIDGLLGTRTTDDAVLCSMCSTTSNTHAPWWQIQFDRKILGLSVRVFGRKDQSNTWQSSNVDVYVSNETFTDGNNGTSVGIIQDPSSDYGETLSLNKSVFQFLRIRRWDDRYMTLCEVKVFDADCLLGRFGDKCRLQCNCVDNMHCDTVSGKCTHNGCKPGWQGDACDTFCGLHQYGPGCSLTCHCNGTDDCNKTSGRCQGDCSNGWKGETCSETCESGYFGDKCGSLCHCHDGALCDHVFGNCSDNRCSAGWKGENCSTACESGYFGDKCGSLCHCHDGALCDHVFGNCSDNRCSAGWKGENCSTACDKSFFGLNCSSLCHCLKDECDHVHGYCSSYKCAPGWTGHNCSTTCERGFFGMNCSSYCHCRKNVECDQVSGKCSDNECSPGWTGHNCSAECMQGYFGNKCETPCHCKDNTVCEHINGYCPGNLCSEGWRFNNCSIACAPGYYGENCSMDCHCEKCHNVNGSCAFYSTQCHGGFRLEGELCTPEDKKPSSTGAIGGGIGAAIAVIIVIAASLLFLRRRINSKNTHRKSDSTELTDISKVQRHENAHENAAYADTDANSKVYANTDCDYYSYNDVVPGIEIHLLWDYIRGKTQPGSSFFEEEFAKLPAGLIHKHDLAAAVENRGKNRYREMFAYDHSRVPLEKEKPNDSEYINASFIHGFGKVTKFIASQGPTNKMIDDFWRMIWQQRVDKIAMLTNLIEMGTLKCLQYWPEEMNGVCTYGGVEIKYASIEETFDYNIRSFDIRRGKESRRVKQFHFKTWPDKDVPETTWGLVDFWRVVDTTDAANISPIVVHCSAGVGRTGTFIALDILISQARMEGSIRPLQMVEALRQQRVNMVQTKEQYKYLHEAVAEALLIGTHPVLTRQFASVVDYMMGKEKESRTTRLEEQFNLIVKSVQEVPESVEEQSSGPTYGNMETVMSENAYRPQLQKRGSKFIQRLGAIFLPTVGNTNALLVCMSPTDQHMEEFWSLVDEHHVTTVISLASPGSATYEACQYLGARGSGRVGQFSVNYIHEKKNIGSVERIFSFRDENHEDEDYMTTIKQFQLTSWLEGHDTPSDLQSFLDLLEEVQKWHPHLSDKRPILIHCQTGFMRCGLTALVLNEIQRIRKENGLINIVESVKTIKTRCRDLVHNKTQYRFCYEAVLKYINTSGTYQNL
ncbi:uncharacterized protein LOC127871510 isoform X2 [Dreissena polymorpha]|uniref:uncharacterized protein LOC127871510 isoform X2 n=1 Tax=Dreissena polymorpha TaxID=45954 RepID=UPI002263B604|nr:uncharacterized protein LOC127871510 isoform X2 [Dreissena polymorpha]